MGIFLIIVGSIISFIFIVSTLKTLYCVCSSKASEKCKEKVVRGLDEETKKKLETMPQNTLDIAYNVSMGVVLFLSLLFSSLGVGCLFWGISLLNL